MASDTAAIYSLMTGTPTRCNDVTCLVTSVQSPIPGAAAASFALIDGNMALTMGGVAAGMIAFAAVVFL
jgi:hypothetical protein